MKADQIRSARPSPCMKDLPIYLNDHLAGSIDAIEMIEDLIDTIRADRRRIFEGVRR